MMKFFVIIYDENLDIPENHFTGENMFYSGEFEYFEDCKKLILGQLAVGVSLDNIQVFLGDRVGVKLDLQQI